MAKSRYVKIMEKTGCSLQEAEKARQVFFVMKTIEEMTKEYDPKVQEYVCEKLADLIITIQESQ
ncbi:MAG: hypothetical protein CBC71_06225 [Rhodobacteraceae bacterium TMED111]|nr:hypothetical protein [Marinovum sp.]OUV41095.1 MAG: hypothetical protein CBC71_06225 [Rhodobacteraceae bacterium TMED111]|tara:strand:- start:19880 stop:20071 length:192 start_codon:yes stop_codon:yes gene_type:complete